MPGLALAAARGNSLMRGAPSFEVAESIRGPGNAEMRCRPQ